MGEHLGSEFFDRAGTYALTSTARARLARVTCRPASGGGGGGGGIDAAGTRGGNGGAGGAGTMLVEWYSA